MIIFTPNTVIRSTDVNANFSELNNKVGVIDTFYFRSNTGTGTRSTAPMAIGEVPGFSSNTITPAVNSTLYVTATFMGILVTANTAGQVYIYVNGSRLSNASGMYFSQATYWQVQSITGSMDLTAGVTYTITCYWLAGNASNFTITNNNTDGDYPVYITGLVVPR